MERKTIKVSRKKFTWAIIILAIIGIWWFSRPNYYPMPAFMNGGFGGGVAESPSVGAPEMGMARDAADMMYAPDYYPHPYPGNPDITDKRQFLKTSYNAEIKTRDVETTTRNVRSIVIEAGGRIDNINESEKYSYFNFVLPKDKFETFRDEIESLTYARLININVSQENRLGQKQSIEEQMNNATSSLADLEKQKTSLTVGHNQRLASLTAQLNALPVGTTTDAERATLRESIDRENRSYQSQLTNLNNQIDSTKKWIAGVEKQDVDFGRDIETVNGSVSINWVSFWELFKIFTDPFPPLLSLIILAIVIWKILGRFALVPKIELV